MNAVSSKLSDTNGVDCGGVTFSSMGTFLWFLFFFLFCKPRAASSGIIDWKTRLISEKNTTRFSLMVTGLCLAGQNQHQAACVVTDQYLLWHHMLLMSQIINQVEHNTLWTFRKQFAVQGVWMRRLVPDSPFCVSELPPTYPLFLLQHLLGRPAAGHMAVYRRRDRMGFGGRRLHPFKQPLCDPLGCSCGKKQLQCPSHLSFAEQLILRFGPCLSLLLALFCCCFFFIFLLFLCVDGLANEGCQIHTQPVWHTLLQEHLGKK